MLKKQNKQQKHNVILGLNRRNTDYVRPFNSTRAKRIADDKLLCKKILSRHGIPTAEIYKVIRNHKQLDAIKWESLPRSFALKPNIGTGGSGILVFYGKKTNSLEWIRPDKSTMGVNELRNHISDILEGMFSMGNRRDIAIIEERVINHPLLKPYSYKGVPDIRVIVFNQVPIMAELRLPTLQSDGVANLHAGGIGVGIDIATGITTTAIIGKGSSFISDIYDIIEVTQDESSLPLSGIQIPRWKEILKIAIKCQEASGLGFLGADIALDRNKGPIVFELNARSGLAVQIANLSGMRERLERIKGLKIKDSDHGIRVAQNLFGGEVEDEIKAVSGRQIVGLIEKVTLFPIELKAAEPQPVRKRKKVKGKPREIKAKVKINPEKIRSRISERTASLLGFKEAIDHFESFEIPKKFKTRSEARQYLEDNAKYLTKHDQILDYIVITDRGNITIRPVIQVKFEITGETVLSNMVISKMKSVPYPAIIGRNDLKACLIDPSKTFLLH